MKPNFAFGPIDSLTQYLLYLSVVTIGIVVPLLIQHAMKRRGEKKILRRTLFSIAQELNLNVGLLKTAQQSFEGVAASLKLEAAAYKAAWASSVQGSTAELPTGAVTSINFPSVDITAWETAKMAQALPLVSSGVLSRISKAYRLLEIYERSRVSYLTLAQNSNLLSAPCKIDDIGTLQRRIEFLLVFEAASSYQARTAASTVEALQEALSAA